MRARPGRAGPKRGPPRPMPKAERDETDMQPGLARAWREAAIAIAIGTCALLLAFREPALAAARVWASSATFNHCFLVVPISAWMLFERREVFATIRPRPSPLLPALAALAGGGAWLAADAAAIYEAQQFALVGLLQCLFLAVLGPRAWRALLAPSLYLFFLVPTGEQLVPPLQDVTTRFIVAGLDALAIPNHVDGVFISTPRGDFHVAEACAGLRFLVASLAYGVLFAVLVLRGTGRRLAFVALCAAVPVLANGLRALGIVLVAYWTNHAYAAGVDHLVYGWGFFVVVTMLLTRLGFAMREAPDGPAAPAAARPATMDRAAPRCPAALASCLVVALACAGPLLSAMLEARAREAAGAWDGLHVSTTSPRWIEAGPVEDWRPAFPTASARRAARFEDGSGRAVDVHLASYARPRKGAEPAGFGNEPHDRGWRRLADGRALVEVNGHALQVRMLRIAAGNARRVVLAWYWVDGGHAGPALAAKLGQLRGRLLTGREAAAAILLSVAQDDDDAALATLRDFLSDGARFAPASPAGRS